jgi:hypothetical protein
LKNQIETPLPLDLDPRAVLFLKELGATLITDENHEYKILPRTHKRVLDLLETENKEL